MKGAKRDLLISMVVIYIPYAMFMFFMTKSIFSFIAPVAGIAALLVLPVFSIFFEWYISPLIILVVVIFASVFSSKLPSYVRVPVFVCLFGIWVAIASIGSSPIYDWLGRQ